MSTVFNVTSDEQDAIADAVLDAARGCVLAVGVRRTTLIEVARRSGRSRPTIYARWPDVRSLIAELLTREMRSVISGVTIRGDRDASPVREQLVTGLAELAITFQENPLLRKIIEVDPELLLPYLLQRLGTSQVDSLHILESWLVAGQRDGSIRSGDVAAYARMVLLTMQSTVLSGQLVSDRLPATFLASELSELLDRYLRP